MADLACRPVNNIHWKRDHTEVEFAQVTCIKLVTRVALSGLKNKKQKTPELHSWMIQLILILWEVRTVGNEIYDIVPQFSALDSHVQA